MAEIRLMQLVDITAPVGDACCGDECCGVAVDPTSLDLGTTAQEIVVPVVPAAPAV